MKAVTTENFLDWATRHRIGYDGHPDAPCLRLRPTPDKFARFWTLPADPAAWPFFAESFLDGCDPWSMGFLWPRSGRWPTGANSASPDEGVREVVLRGAGIPDGWAGAVGFEKEEAHSIIALLFIYLAFGWCVDDDLYFIPDHGRQIIQTDHHDVIHVECLEDFRVEQFVQHMSDAGYHLPTDLPDGTFRRPEWMSGTSD
jgi:hypothetical protein